VTVSTQAGGGGDSAAAPTGQPAQQPARPKAPVDPVLAQLMGGNAGGANTETTSTPY